jgi:NADH/NAD ratio-sensing transcriptional regulator Rex
MKTLPGKTVERLSQYRRAHCSHAAASNRNYVFSHELAAHAAYHCRAGKA